MTQPEEVQADRLCSLSANTPTGWVVCCVVCVSSGIGAGLVDEFVKGGAKLLITGRREEELKKVQAKHAQHVLKYYVGDAGKEADRIKLFEQATADFPQLNVLINNAGIQRRGDHAKEIQQPWSERQQEIDINFCGPIHLTSLFIPHLLKQKQAAIINVTSGLAYVPFPNGPVYSATKAGIHQYTLALRPLLAETSVRVCELAPPAVKSNLGGEHDFGEECDEFCAHVYQRFVSGELEFGYKFSDLGRMGSRHDHAKAMLGMMKDPNSAPKKFDAKA